MTNKILILSAFMLCFTEAFSQDMKYTINEKIIDKQIVVEESLDSVWWRWTTSEGIASFFAPDSKVELKSGGFFEMYFLPEEEYGKRGGEGSRILSFLPHEMLSFTWSAPPYIPEIRNHEHKTWVVIQFSKTEEENVLVRIRHLGWLDGEKWDETYNYFDKAWPAVLNSLAKTCKN